ncbi:MAG TPA: FBP domain-containing protein [Polyangia bacterium]|nr:FBP domain-containing protein [Polyangia bacterium]
MSAVTSEAELRACFRDIDRDEVELAAELVLPLAVDRVVGWIVGPRAFLLFRERAGAPVRGLVLHTATGGRPDRLGMCHACHAVRGRGVIKLMTVRVDERSTVGLFMCSDLRCLLAGDATSVRRIGELAARI